MRVARLGAVLLVLSWYGRPAGAQTPAFQEHRQDVATLVTSEIEAFTGHVDNHCGIFTLPESLDGPPAVTRKEIGAALRCVRAAQRRGEAAWAVWQQGGVDATLFQGVAASKVSAVHLVQSEGNVGGVRLTPCLRPEIRKDGTIDCGVTPPATGRDLRKAVGRLAHDVEVTGGLSRSAVAALADPADPTGADAVIARLDDIVAETLRAVHAAGDEAWPRCPRHHDHPLELRDGWWFCTREAAYISELGSLWRVLPRKRR